MSDAIVRGHGGAQPENNPLGTVASNEVTLTIGGKRWEGWLGVRVTAGAERVPRDFTLQVTERYPGTVNALAANPGAACVLNIGNDPVVTGWVDTYAPEIGPKEHGVVISGRGKACDLVDCSALVNGAGSQFNSQQFVQIVQALASPFGITATALDDASQVIPQFVVTLGETPYEIMERIARYVGFLVYDGADGNLILARAGSTKAASGFVQGVNVEKASLSYSFAERFSIYKAGFVSIDTFGQVTGSSGNLFYTATDSAITRYRPRVIISEQAAAPQPGSPALRLAQLRADWELTRRRGRSQALRLTTDTWRDSAGALWQPNTLAPISLPILKLTPTDPWVISEVVFLRDENGTRAELLLMPKEAFAPEPSDIGSFNYQLANPGSAPTGGAAKDQ